MQFTHLFAALGLFACVLSAPASQLQPEDFDGHCKMEVLDFILQPFGACMVHIEGEKQPRQYTCTKNDQCPGDGAPCHIHCVPSPYGGGECTPKCAADEQ